MDRNSDPWASTMLRPLATCCTWFSSKLEIAYPRKVLYALCDMSWIVRRSSAGVLLVNTAAVIANERGRSILASTKLIYLANAAASALFSYFSIVHRLDEIVKTRSVRWLSCFVDFVIAWIGCKNEVLKQNFDENISKNLKRKYFFLYVMKLLKNCL